MKPIKLTEAEQDLMEILWKNGPSFMKDILERYPEPQPAATTVATVLKRMQSKKLIGYKTFGNSRRYHPLIGKDEYFRGTVGEMVRRFFGNSAPQFASFFTANSKMSKEELEELRRVIDEQLKNRD
ncbi:MAG: BlaI/MecI/CopY family transcriptional regulator [Chryseobacterium sp.]|nr:MAG: BlaI/MecI/CopY family transcriptional regulator [Chryseobacterium sp.]